MKKTLFTLTIILSFIILPAHANTCQSDTPHCVSMQGLSGNKGKIVRIDVYLKGSQIGCVNDTINDNPSILRAMNNSVLKGEYFENQVINIKFTQCYDVNCYRNKSLDVDEFKVSKTSTNQYTTTPHNFTINLDQNYGETCDIN